MAIAPGNKHCNNKRLIELLRKIKDDWPIIYCYLGGLCVMWSYFIKHIFTKYATQSTLGQLRKDLHKMKEKVDQSIGQENPLHQLTRLNNDLFSDQSQPDDAIEFSYEYMTAIETGNISGIEIGHYYHGVLHYIDSCLCEISKKLGRDDTVEESSYDDLSTTGNNQFAESLFAVVKRLNESLQKTQTDGRFQVNEQLFK